MPERMPERRVSYAQNGEDVRLWRALRHVEEPFYVEVGASHPYEDSTTAALSAEGWRGVLIEPDTDLVTLLRDARPRDVVVGAAAHSRAGVLMFEPGAERGLGTTSATGGLPVPAVRIVDVLEDLSPAAVHAMVVDVEGGELEALRGAGLDRWRPWVLCVEATAPNSRELVHETWEPLVLEAGYRYVAFDGLNRWYVAVEHAELVAAVEEPLGVLDRMLDGWVRRAEVVLEDELERVRAELVAADRRLAETDRASTAELADLEQAWATKLADEQRSWSARLAEGEHAWAARLAETESSWAARLVEAKSRSDSQLEHLAAQRDQSLEREAVMLRSKSWRVTAPLRALRWNAGRVAQARGLAPAPAAPAVALARPGDDRRIRALRSRLAGAREGRS